MSKTYKRIASILLSICLLLSICVPAYASIGATDAEIQDQMLRLLAATEAEAEHYGLDCVDFSAVPIGHEIPAYRVTDSGTLIRASVRLFPIVADGSMISLFTVYDSPDGKIHVQLGGGLAEEINQNLASGKEFAIIYDDEGAYLYSEKKLTLLGCAGRKEKGDALVSSLSAPVLNSVETCAAAQKYTLDAIEYMASLPAPQAVNPVAHVPVEIIKQPSGSMICWAVAGVSILNYVKGTHYTYQDIVNKFGTKTPMAIHEVIPKLREFYNLEYWFKIGECPDKEFVLSHLNIGKPIYGEFIDYDISTHAMVICGINTITNTFSIMDPESDAGTYTVATISDDWSFAPAYDPVHPWHLNSYGYYSK